MAHNHGSHHGRLTRVLLFSVILNAAYVLIEATFGFLAGSIALLADAGHNLGDVLGLVLTWAAVQLAGYSATERNTYGWRRSTVLSALLNSVLLLSMVGGIAVEAIHRLLAPTAADEKTVIVVSIVGIIVNSFTAVLLMRDHHDLNVRGAFLHMVADAGVSLAVALSGVIGLYTGWLYVDAVASLLVAAVIFQGTWSLLRESVHLAMDGVPAGIDTNQVLTYLNGLPGVDNPHDLHIWALSTTETALTVHLVKSDGRLDDNLVCQITKELHDRFGIEHVNVQLESANCLTQCHLAH